MGELPREVAAVVDRYITSVDRALGGVVDGLYLVGSLALDDYRSSQSDIDFVAVSCRALTERELDALAEIHADLRPAIQFDGIYVARSELAKDPSLARAPAAHEGRFQRSGGFEANPVVWRVLAQRAVHLRGPAPDELVVWSDPHALRCWNVDNLRGYWAGLVARWRAFKPSHDLVVHHHGLPWLVLGVSRLHHTIATGEVISKTAAARWALERFDERWHALISTCVALRTGLPISTPDCSPGAVWSDGLDFAEHVIADALALTRG